MTRIYFDLGNSCIKWKVESHSLLDGVYSYSEFAQSLPHLLADIGKGNIHAIIASVVKGDRYSEFLRTLRACSVQTILECVVSPSTIGVKCGYEEVARLGIDRWLAVVAAWHLLKSPCVIMDLGTAATIDFIDGNAVHLGGFILPGLRLGVSALLQGTSNITVDFDGAEKSNIAPGRNTTEAVYHGSIFTMKAAAQQAVTYLEMISGNAKLLITGGDADILARAIECDHIVVKDLVFQGMRLLADAGLLVDTKLQEG